MPTIKCTLKYLFLLLLSTLSLQLLYTANTQNPSLLTSVTSIVADLDLPKLYPLSLLAVGFSLIYILWLRKHSTFWETLFHELTHALFAAICLRKIHGLKADYGAGGQITYSGKSNWVISLAPYFFPLPTAFLLFMSLLLAPAVKPYWELLIVLSYTFSLLTFARQFSFNQPDIKKSGRFFSSLIIIQLNFYIALFLLYFLSDNSTGYLNIIKTIVYNLYQMSGQMLLVYF